MPVPKDLAHPDFPHGELRGYTHGCRRTSPCPATPSCSDVNLQRRRERTEANRGLASAHPDWPRIGGVKVRLEAAITAAGIEQVAEYAHMTAEAVEAVRRDDHPWIDPTTADALNHAWSWFVRGFNTLDPNVPHGDSHTYNQLCCRCQRCTRNHSVRQKKHRAGIVLDTSLVPVPGALARRVARIMDAAGSQAVAAAAGVDPRSVRKGAVGGPLRRDVIGKLATVSLSDALSRALRVPAEPHAQRLGRAWALGYPMSFVAERTGVPRGTLDQLVHMQKKYAYGRTASAVERFVEEVGDSPATPENTGLPAVILKRAKTYARKRGFYPPAFYDDDNNLIVRAIPEHPWAKLDERAGDMLEAAHACAHGATHAEAAVRANCNLRSIQRWLKPLGLKYQDFGSLDYAASVDITRRVADVYAAYEAGEVGPVTAALTLGLLDPNKLLRDHPEVEAWNSRNTDTSEAVA